MKKLFYLCLAIFLSAISLHAAKYHLIWANTSHFYEVDWIREVLSEVDYEEIVDNDFSVYKDNSILVICAGDAGLYRPYLKRFVEMNYKYGVIILSDEAYQCPLEHEFDDDAAFIYKHYWSKDYCAFMNAKPFPLGYGIGLWRDCARYAGSHKPASQRKYTWAFAGQVTKSTRLSMHGNMLQIPNGYVHQISQWKDSGSLSKSNYRELMQDAIFAPSPRGGWNLESFRVYEALECGAIPIVEKSPLDYFHLLLGDYPFLAVHSWDDAPAIIQQLLNDPERLENLRARCFEWWMNYKRSLKQDMREFIDRQMQK